MRIRGGNDSFPYVYLEEGLNIEVPWVTVTNWESDSQRPWIAGTFDPDFDVEPPSDQPDGISIRSTGVTVSNLV